MPLSACEVLSEKFDGPAPTNLLSACEVLSEQFDTAAPTNILSACEVLSEQLNSLESQPLRSVSGRSYPQQDRTIVSRLTRLENVSFLNSGPVDLYTSPTGKTTLITEIVLECTTGTAVTVDGSAGAGLTPLVFNVIPNTTLTNFRLAGDVFALVPSGKSVQVGSAQALVLNRVGSSGTALLATVDVYGIVV